MCCISISAHEGSTGTNQPHDAKVSAVPGCQGADLIFSTNSQLAADATQVLSSEMGKSQEFLTRS